jgi:hypothetical protein
MWWADTTAGILKQRNAANSAWINVLADKADLAGAEFTGRLIASLNSNVTLSGINGSFIVGGDGSGSHIAMDGNEIQAKGSPTTTSALFINNIGGNVEFGGDILAPKLTASTGVLFGTDTAAANTLDDYEEGTWTPAFLGGSGISYSVQSGKYTKIGNVVNCTASLTMTASSNDNSPLQIAGLPFAADDSHESVNAAIGRFSDFLDSYSELVSQYRLSNSAVLLLKNSDTPITYTDAKSTGSLQIAFSYLT